jgi:hypothetical protein
VVNRDASAQRGKHGVVDIKLSAPGGEDHEFIGAEPHPTAEQLFAGAWSACYIAAFGVAASLKKVTLPPDYSVDIQVDVGQTGPGWFLGGSSIITSWSGAATDSGRRCTTRCATRFACGAGKKAPTGAILDSQSVKVSNHGGVRGYDAGKKILGRKRHLLVDTLGLILHVVVHSTALQDRDGARLVLPVLLQRFGWLRCLFVDGGYAGTLVAWVKELLPHRGLKVEIVKRNDVDKHRFAILPKRWIVERTFGWLSKFRRLAKDYEFRTDNSETMILIAATRLMLARLA